MDFVLPYYLEASLDRETEKSNMGIKHSAAIIKGKHLIGKDCNHLSSGDGYSVHAEISLLEKLKGKD